MNEIKSANETKGAGARNHGNALPPSCASCVVWEKTEWACLNKAADDVLKSARRLTAYQVGETLFHQHDPSHGVYCLMEGLVILKQLDTFGNETAFRLLFPGQTCGWRSLFAGQSHMATAVVLETSKVCFISTADLEIMMSADSTLSREFLKTLATDPGPADAILLRNAFLPARIRLAHLLLILAGHCLNKPIENEVRYRLPVKRKHIAALIGTSVETVSRTIRELEDDSLAYFDQRNVLIPDIGKLQQEVG